VKRKDYAGRGIGCGTWAVTLCLSIAVFLCTGVAAQSEVYLKIGILKEPKTLNPFQATDAWTKRVIGVFYQPLYIREPDTLALVPWLAEDQPIFDAQRKTLTIRLRQMQWDDGTEFGAEDVVFTGETLRRFRVPKYYDHWKFVKIEALDKRTVQLTMDRPLAPLYTRTLTSWIVQKRQWGSLIRKAEKRLKEITETEKAKGKGEEKALEAGSQAALKVIRTHVVKRPVGLGPFKFKTWKAGSYIQLLKNDLFFGRGQEIAGRELGPFIEGVIFKIYDSQGGATSALEKGDIDFLWKGISHGFVRDLMQNPDIKVQHTLDSGYRYLAFNLRKAPTSDPAFRQALAHLIDKDFIIKRVLHSLGKRIDTVIPPGNTLYFNPNTPTYGKGMDRGRRTQEAYRILTKAGYQWKKPPIDAHGGIQRGEGMIKPNGKAMPSVTISTPPAEYDVEVATAGQIIQEWLKDFGIPALWKPMAFGSLLNQIRNEKDFDMFVMGWRSLPIDPDYLKRFFHSSYGYPRGRNYTGYSNIEFDRMAEFQAQTMDSQARRKIVLDLQSRLMVDLPYIPLYVPFRLEGIRVDRFEGWTTMLGGIGNAWTFCLVRPIESHEGRKER
jgi:ABC-type transport system substrate-binding protein